MERRAGSLGLILLSVPYPLTTTPAHSMKAISRFVGNPQVALFQSQNTSKTGTVAYHDLPIWRGILILFSLFLLLTVEPCVAQDTGAELKERQATFREGKATLSCFLTCVFTWGYNRLQMKRMHDLALWEELSNKVLEIGFESDLSYFYLARAAEGLGFLEAAELYYRRSVTVSTSSKRCASSSNLCDGFAFPRDSLRRLETIAAVKAKTKPQIANRGSEQGASEVRPSDARSKDAEPSDSGHSADVPSTPVQTAGAEASQQPPTNLATGSAQTAEVLTNEDILRLKKTGLSDAIILSLIQRSSVRFDLATNAVVKLSQAGLSDQIIQAMIEAGKGSVGRNTALSPQSQTGASQQETLPTAYGVYVREGDRYRSLPVVEVSKVIGLRVGDAGFAVDGFSREPPLYLSNATPELIFYLQNLNIGALRMAKLDLLQSAPARSFNIRGTDPQFFQLNYGVSPSQLILINLWRPKTKIVPRIEPVLGRPDMYKVSVSTPLTNGRYAIWFGDNLRDGDVIFSTSVSSKNSSAFYFGVGR